MKILIKIYCFLFRHDIVEEGKYDNGRSLFGGYKCLRCDKTFQWQYDK